MTEYDEYDSGPDMLAFENEDLSKEVERLKAALSEAEANEESTGKALDIAYERHDREMRELSVAIGLPNGGLAHEECVRRATVTRELAARAEAAESRAQAAERRILDARRLVTDYQLGELDTLSFVGRLVDALADASEEPTKEST